MAESMPSTRHLAEVMRTSCMVCKGPVDLTVNPHSAAIFEPGDGRTPHRCPELAMIRWIRLMDLGSKELG